MVAGLQELIIVKAVSMPSRTATLFVIGGLRGSTAGSGSSSRREFFFLCWCRDGEGEAP